MSIHITYKNLTEFPMQIVDSKDDIKYLCLYGNRFTTIPSVIGEFKTLKHLDISDNLLTDFPMEICNLTQLQNLGISYNHFKTLPSELGKLVNLTHFTCDHNLLHSLPEELGNIDTLGYIGCGKNNFDNPHSVKIQTIIDMGNLGVETLSPDGIQGSYTYDVVSHKQRFEQKARLMNASEETIQKWLKFIDEKYF
jgi:Leucine-rich repeat (LRR) protein